MFKMGISQSYSISSKSNHIYLHMMHKQSSNSSCSSTTSGGKSSCSNYRDQGTKIGAKAPNPASIARKIITTQCLQHKKSNP